MTDSPTPAEPGPIDADVELASAHLDGEAGTDERARAEAPEVQAHLATFASVADRVRDVPPPPGGLLDDHVARAMAAFDDGARVAPLRRSPVAARPWWQRIPVGAVAAALVVVALIGAIGLASTLDDDGDDTATSTFDAGDGGLDSADDAAPDDGDASAGAMEESTTLDPDAQFDAMGGRAAYDGYDSLADDLAAQLAAGDGDAEAPVAESDVSTTQSERSGDEDAADGVDPCGAVGLLGLDPADVVLVRPVLVGADEATAVVHDADDGRRLTVVGDATCAVTFERLL
jgi:hypothetical protein